MRAAPQASYRVAPLNPERLVPDALQLGLHAPEQRPVVPESRPVIGQHELELLLQRPVVRRQQVAREVQGQGKDDVVRERQGREQEQRRELPQIPRHRVHQLQLLPRQAAHAVRALPLYRGDEPLQVRVHVAAADAEHAVHVHRTREPLLQGALVVLDVIYVPVEPVALQIRHFARLLRLPHRRFLHEAPSHRRGVALQGVRQRQGARHALAKRARPRYHLVHFAEPHWKSREETNGWPRAEIRLT